MLKATSEAKQRILNPKDVEMFTFAAEALIIRWLVCVSLWLDRIIVAHWNTRLFFENTVSHGYWSQYLFFKACSPCSYLRHVATFACFLSPHL